MHGSSWILQLALFSFIDRPGMGPPGWWEAKFDMKTSCREHLFHSAVAKSLSVGFPPGCHVLPFLLHQRHGPPPHGYLSRAEISTNLWVSRLQKLDPMSQPGRLLTWVLHLPTWCARRCCYLRSWSAEQVDLFSEWRGSQAARTWFDNSSWGMECQCHTIRAIRACRHLLRP